MMRDKAEGARIMGSVPYPGPQRHKTPTKAIISESRVKRILLTPMDEQKALETEDCMAF